MKYVRYKYLLWDFILLAALVLLSVFLISFYLRANYLNTGYADWMVQAFRIRSLENFGLTSWTHTWSNGISLWRTYQFIPHALTIVIEKIFAVDIPRAMVISTIIQFILLRVFIYVFLRLLSFSRFAAFGCSILSFDISQYWGGVGDYSILSGFTFFPIIIFLWVQNYRGKIQYLFPYILGLLFYIHPLLAIYSFALWLCGIFFSGHKIFSIAKFTQLVLFLASSSVFWLPIVVRTSYSYSSELFADRNFLSLTISRFGYYGLSFFIFLFFILAFSSVLMIKSAHKNWVKILYIYTIISLIAVVLGLTIDLPRFIAQLQYTRGMTLIGIAAIFAIAPLMEKLGKIKSTFLKAIVFFVLGLVMIESIWFTSIFSPQPDSHGFEDPVFYYIKQTKKDLTDGVIWTSALPLSTYYAPLNLRYPDSYMGQFESNQIPPRMSPLILYSPFLNNAPQVSTERLTDYFKITGTKYIFLEESSPFTSALINSTDQSYIDQGQLNMPSALYHVFESTWPIKNAVVIDNKYKNAMVHFPFDLKFTNENNQTVLDNYVKDFVKIIYQPANIPLSISYPTQDSIAVKIPEKVSSNMVYINESYDASWNAFFGDTKAEIRPVGPNYMLVTLPAGVKSSTLILKHNWPLSFYASWYLTGLIPCVLLLVNFLQKLPVFKAKQEESLFVLNPIGLNKKIDNKSSHA